MRTNVTHNLIALIAGVALCHWAPAGAQQYVLADTLWVKVTYYDFHTNSNFITPRCGTATGMVQDYLDADRKPVLLANRCGSDHVNEWFRPSGGTGSTYDPRSGRWTGLTPYAPGGVPRSSEWVGTAYNPAYEFADVVMYDSLPLVLSDASTGTYNFTQTNQQGGFWPLDNKGFGMEQPSDGHSFGFTMEVHHQFEYQGGEYFEFRGDDDVWVFINGVLALDLGGMQAETRRGLNLDQVAQQLGIVKGEVYWFDFFFCERSGNQSNCEITTNILTPSRPASLYVRTDSLSFDRHAVGPSLSDTTVSAGDTVRLWAYVFDDTLGFHPDWDTSITWTVVDHAGNPIADANFTGNSAQFYLTEAFSTVTVFLAFQHPEFPGVIVRDTLRLFVKPGAADSVEMFAGGDTLLGVQGRRDDTFVWESIPADWYMVDLSLSGVLSQAPRMAPSWVLHPSGLGNGRIRVSLGMDAITTPDTVRAIFRTPPPNQARMYLITPASQLRAGDTIRAVVEIRNDNGLLPGSYCYPGDANGNPVYYYDTLGAGGRPTPHLITGSGSVATIGVAGGQGYPLAQCFTQGRDTVRVILYYAPADPDSMHRLSVVLGSLTASTDPFALLPGLVDSVILTQQDGSAAPRVDTLLASHDSLIVQLLGFDTWGNPIGVIPPGWTFIGFRQDPSVVDGGTVAWLTPDTVRTNDAGQIIACQNGHCDTIGVTIIGAEQSILRAVTRDSSGNGYLDHIEVTFVYPVSFAGFDVANVHVTYDNVTLTARAIEGDASRSDVHFVFELNENRTASAQTAWTPEVWIGNHPLVTAMPSTAEDGAGPVAWRARYYPASSTTAGASDTLRVTLSEEIECHLLTQHAPAEVFTYYDGTAGPAPSALDHATFIEACTNPGYRASVAMILPIGSWEIIPYVDSLQLTDGTTDRMGNPPPADSIGRRAVIESGVQNEIKTVVGPNPFIPGADIRSVLGVRTLVFYDNVIAGHSAGTLIAVTTTVPLRNENGSFGKVTIYDAVGNLVQDGLTLRQAASDRDYGVVWTGTNRNDRRVGVGGYLAIIRCTDIAGKRVEQRAKIGVRR